MESAGALIVDFHPPELYEISFCHLEIIQSGLFWQNSPNGLRHTYALLSHGWHWCDTSKGHSLGQPQNHRAGTFHQVPHHQGKLPDFESLRHHAIAKTSLDRGTDPLGPLKRLAFPVLKGRIMFFGPILYWHCFIGCLQHLTISKIDLTVQTEGCLRDDSCLKWPIHPWMFFIFWWFSI